MWVPPCLQMACIMAVTSVAGSVNICPVFLAINSHPGILRGITEVPICKGDWGFLTLAETRVTPLSPSHNLRKTSRCSQLASAGTTDPTFLKATKQWNTTKAYRLRKGTLQVQSEDLQLQQPLPQTQREMTQNVRCDCVRLSSLLSKCHLEWGEPAHPFSWIPRSFPRVGLQKCGSQLAPLASPTANHAEKREGVSLLFLQKSTKILKC